MPGVNDLPLHGARVLDLSWGMPGGLATMLLADYGAEVISIDRPGGSTDDGLHVRRLWGRNKRSISCDLKNNSDRELAVGLARTSDILVESLGPDRAEVFGLDYESLRACNPGLVYCSISGYGHGLSPNEHSGYEALVAARLGVMAAYSGSRREGPAFPGHPAVGYSTALVATIGILAALRARLVCGEGDFVDASLQDGILAQSAMNWWSERGVTAFKARSNTGRLDLGRRRLLLDKFECADGNLIQIHTGATGGFTRLMDAVGLRGQISEPSGAVETGTELTEEDLQILGHRLPEIFASETLDYWLKRLWSHDVAALPVQEPTDVFGDEQVEFAGLVQRIEDPVLGEVDVVGPPVRLNGSRGRRVTPAPDRDADGKSIRRSGWITPGLADGPFSGESIDSPLSGLRLIECSVWFACAYGNRLLGELGADVIKIEPLQGDPMRPMPDAFEGAEAGKRCVALNLKSPEGAALFRDLVKEADIVSHNLRPGAAERLGIDFDTVREITPDIVYLYAPGFGSSGPKSLLQSFAPLQSGFVGLFHESVGKGNEPRPPFGNEDYYNGLLGAVGMLLAVVGRERGGRGGTYVECPQMHSSVFATSLWVRGEGGPRCLLPEIDEDQTGRSPTYGIYQCLEGWICLACVAPHHRQHLADLVIGDDDAADLRGALQYRFVERTAAEWVEALQAQGVPCEVVREDAWLPEYLCDPEMIQAGRVAVYEHPEYGKVHSIRRIVNLRNRRGPMRGRSHLLGEDTERVLRELGVSGERVAALRERGVVKGR